MSDRKDYFEKNKSCNLVAVFYFNIEILINYIKN